MNFRYRDDMLTDDLRTFVHRAIDHARTWNNGEDHTVASGLLTASGRIVLGLNTHHFLSGPCGKAAALPNHAATAPEDPIIAVDAAHGPTGTIIAPCGKCRQIMFEIAPHIQFVVRDASGLATRTAEQLLPFAFDSRATEHLQRIYMWEGYEAATRTGAKRQTIRIEDPFRPGPANLTFEKYTGEVVTIPAVVTAVRSVARHELTEDDAIRDGFDNLGELHAALDRHYPGLQSSGTMDIVTVELADRCR